MSGKTIETFKLLLLTTVTLILLAANSILCRAALLDSHLDAYTFSFLRLFFGALVLLIILLIREKKISINLKTNWLNSFFLFLYAITFSYSYVDMEAGIGTLILFAVVQLTMIVFAIIKKEHLTAKKAFGIAIAFSGLVYLLFPSEEFSLSLFHTFLMFLSGIAWAFYTILGKTSKNALNDTTENFLKTIVFLLIFFVLFVDSINITAYGIFLAFISGGIASGIGYVLWYKILKDMEIITASVIQLIVPVIAIFLSILILDETLTSTLILSTALIISGIFISIYKKSPK